MIDGRFSPERIGNDAGRFDTLHQRQSRCDTGAAVAPVRVDAVVPDRVHPQQRLACGGYRAGEISQAHAFAAPLHQTGGFHEVRLTQK